MAARFWVLGTGTWDAADTSHWSATSGGAAGASVPTSSDTVTFDSNSGTAATVTIGAAAASSSVTINKSDLTLTHSAGSTVTGAVTLTAGTLNTNGQTCSWGSFSSSNSNTRTLTLGASAITVTGAASGAWDCTTTTNLTFTPGTSVITLSGSSMSMRGGGLTYYGLVFSGTGGTQTVQSVTCTNFTRTGGASKTDALALATSITVTGTLTLSGNSATNRILVSTSTVGTAYTITAAVVSLSNVDFMDITGAGAAAPFTGTSIGGCGGNTQITATTPATQTHTASAGGSWSDASKWTSRVPLPQDDVIVDVNTTGTLTADMPRLGKSIDFTGFAGTFVNSSTSCALYGSLTIASGMTWTIGTAGYEFRGRGSYTFTSNGKYANSWSLIAPGGTLTLGDAFVGTTHTIVVYNGTLNTAGFAVTCGRLADTGTATRGMTFGASTVNLSNTTATSNFSVTSTGMTMSAASATFVISAASANARTFVGAGFTYGTLTYTVASSTGALTLTGANTFDTLNIGAGRPLILPSSVTTTVTNMNAAGVPNGYTYLPGVSGNYLSTPDSAALSITGDIDMRFRVALNDWTPATEQLLADKDSPGVVGYDMRITTAGNIRVNGVASNAVSSVAVPAADGTTTWVRATIRTSDGRVQFFTASGALTNPTAGDFTQLGTDQAVAAGLRFDTAAGLTIGAFNDGSVGNSAGKLYRAQIRNGLDGTLVFDADLTTKPCGARTFTESSASAATVTINGTSAQAGDGCVVLAASTPGTFATLAKAGGGYVYGLDYLSISDIHAT